MTSTGSDSIRCLGSREIEIRSSLSFRKGGNSHDTEDHPPRHSFKDSHPNAALPPSHNNNGSSGYRFRPALLIAFQVESHLQLQISDGTASLYQKDIHPSDTKIVYPDNCSDDNKVQILATYLLNEMDGISLRLDDTTTTHDNNNKNTDASINNNDDGIKVAIRQRLDTGIVKMIWSGILPNVTSVVRSTTTTATTTTCFPFLQTLGRTIRQEQERYHALQDQCNGLQIDLLGWKDTAEKLSEDVWQSEKDALIHNFWTLYRKTHEELRKTQLELQQLEDRHMAAGSGSIPSSLSYQQQQRQQQGNKGIGEIQQHPRANKSNTASIGVTEQPDDQDELLYDRTTIDRLAAGPLSQPFRTAALTTKSKGTKQGSTGPRKNQKTTVRSKPQPSDGPTSITATTTTPATTTSVTNPSLRERSDEQVTVGFQLADVGVVSSAKELFQDLAANRKKRAFVQDAPTTTTSSSDAKAVIKKTKISDAVDDDRRKALEKMAAILGDDDGDDDDDDW